MAKATITVLAGTNGAGKSSLLNALELAVEETPPTDPDAPLAVAGESVGTTFLPSSRNLPARKLGANLALSAAAPTASPSRPRPCPPSPVVCAATSAPSV